MMKKLYIVIIISISVVIIGWFIFFYNESNIILSEIQKPSSTLEIAQSGIEIEQSKIDSIRVKKEITALRQEVALLRRDIANIQLQHKELFNIATKKTGIGNIPTEEKVDTYQENAETLEVAFNQEDTDKQWASNATSVIHEILAQDGMEVITLQSLECRSKSCRMQLDNNESETMSLSLPTFMWHLSKISSNTTMVDVKDSNGRKELVLYINRNENIP